jgi:hypothetical protein
VTQLRKAQAHFPANARQIPPSVGMGKPKIIHHAAQKPLLASAPCSTIGATSYLASLGTRNQPLQFSCTILNCSSLLLATSCIYQMSSPSFQRLTTISETWPAHCEDKTSSSSALRADCSAS